MSKCRRFSVTEIESALAMRRDGVRWSVVAVRLGRWESNLRDAVDRYLRQRTEQGWVGKERGISEEPTPIEIALSRLGRRVRSGPRPDTWWLDAGRLVGPKGLIAAANKFADQVHLPRIAYPGCEPPPPRAPLPKRRWVEGQRECWA